MKKTTIVVIAMLLFAGLASAEDQAIDQKMPTLCGLGAAISANGYKGTGTSVSPVPIIFAEKNRFFIHVNQAGYTLYKNEPFQAYVFLQPRLFMGYRSTDSDSLAGMDRRNWSVDAGLGAEFDVPNLKGSKINLELLQDILSNSNGQEIDLTYYHLFDMRPFFLKPKAGLR